MKIAFILLSFMIAYVIANKTAEGDGENVEQLCVGSGGLVKKIIYVEDQSQLFQQEQRATLKGRRGKTGAKGQKGDIGPTGDKGEVGQTGERGFCSCAVTDERFNDMQTAQQELISKNEEMNSKNEEMNSTIQEMMSTINHLQHEVESLKAVNKPNCENKEGLYFGGKCFFLTKTTAFRFSEAKNACTQQGGSQLASITSAELYNALVSFIRPQVEDSVYRLWTSGRYDPITGGQSIKWGDNTTPWPVSLLHLHPSSPVRSWRVIKLNQWEVTPSTQQLLPTIWLPSRTMHLRKHGVSCSTCPPSSLSSV